MRRPGSDRLPFFDFCVPRKSRRHRVHRAGTTERERTTANRSLHLDAIHVRDVETVNESLLSTGRPFTNETEAVSRARCVATHRARKPTSADCYELCGTAMSPWRR